MQLLNYKFSKCYFFQNFQNFSKFSKFQKQNIKNTNYSFFSDRYSYRAVGSRFSFNQTKSKAVYNNINSY